MPALFLLLYLSITVFKVGKKFLFIDVNDVIHRQKCLSAFDEKKRRLQAPVLAISELKPVKRIKINRVKINQNCEDAVNAG